MIFVNFFMAWARNTWARWRGYQILADGDTQQKRLDICRYCQFNVSLTCTKCGCLLHAKVMLNAEKCPINKWGRIWKKNPSGSEQDK